MYKTAASFPITTTDVEENNNNVSRQPITLGRRERGLGQSQADQSAAKRTSESGEGKLHLTIFAAKCAYFMELVQFNSCARVAGTSNTDVGVSSVTAGSSDTRMHLRLSSSSLLMQSLSASGGQAPSSPDSGVILPHTSQQQPWQQQGLISSRSISLQAGMGPNAANTNAAAAAEGATTPRQRPLSQFQSPWARPYPADASQDSAASNSRISSILPEADAAVQTDYEDGKLQEKQLSEELPHVKSPPQTAVPEYSIFSPTRQRMVEEIRGAIAHNLSGTDANRTANRESGVYNSSDHNAPSHEPEEKRRTVLFGRRAAASLGPTLAAVSKLVAVSESEGGPRLAADPNLAAGLDLATGPNLAAADRRDSLELLPDLDELLPDGDTSHAWSARPSNSKKELNPPKAQLGSFTARLGAASFSQMLRSSAAGVRDAGSGEKTSASSGHTVATDPAVDWATNKTAPVAAAEEESIIHNAVAITGTAMVKAAGVSDQHDDRKESEQVPAHSLSTDLRGGEGLHADESSLKGQRMDSCSGMEDRCRELEGRLKSAEARCAELEAELARKEAAAQLQASEAAQLAARCESLNRRLADSEAAAQLARSERSRLEERSQKLSAELVGMGAAMEALKNDHAAARARCEELEGLLVDREYGIEQAWEELGLAQERCEELQQKQTEVRSASQ